MELKLFIAKANDFCISLLIVPYGIETLSLHGVSLMLQLLIVPYGIETYLLFIFVLNTVTLLIVPYGIETI